MPVRFHKQLENETANEIETRPTFINHVQLARAGTDVFMDIGIVPASDLLGVREKQDVRFIVLDRVVMGLETFMTLYDSVVDLHRLLREAGDLREKIIVTQPAT